VKRFNSQTLILIGATLFVLYLAGVPLVMLLYGSIRSAPIGEPGATYTIQNYIKAYFDKEFYLLLLNSVYYALGTCTLTFLIGTFLAWVSERTNTPLKKLFVVMSLIPFIIPGILSTISWILLLSPKIGLINLAVKEILRLESAPFNIYSMWGMIWAESIHLYPLVFLLMSAAFRNMDTSLEEASLSAGSSMLNTFWRITLPLMRPAMFSVLLINFVRGIEAFEVPALIGVPAKISVFTTKIFLAIHQFPSDFGLAGAYAVTLLAISTIGVLIYGKITRKEERFATVTGKGYRPRVIDLRGLEICHPRGLFLNFLSSSDFAGLCVALVFVYSLLRRSLARAHEQNDLSQFPIYSELSLGHDRLQKQFLSVRRLGNVGDAFDFNDRLDHCEDQTTGPGAARQYDFYSDRDAWHRAGRESYLGLLDLAHSDLRHHLGFAAGLHYKFMPYGIRAASASMIQINKELEEASLTAGGTWFQTFRKVILPLLMPGFTAGWIYISIIALRELSTSILLYSYNSTVLSIMAFDLWEGGQYTYVCALGVLMVLLLLVMAFTARKLGAKVGIAE